MPAGHQEAQLKTRESVSWLAVYYLRGAAGVTHKAG